MSWIGNGNVFCSSYETDSYNPIWLRTGFLIDVEMTFKNINTY